MWRKGNACALLLGMLNWFIQYRKQYGASSENWKLFLIKSIKIPAIPLLDIYPNKMKIVIRKDTCPPYPMKSQLHFPRSLVFTISQCFPSVWKLSTLLILVYVLNSKYLNLWSNLFFPCPFPSDCKSLPFCSVPWSSFLFAIWDVAWFMICWIKPIRSLKIKKSI